ncbi:hypothetical protein CI789_05440 [Erwinia persicina]|uniref:UDP-2,3-diacylglucosamine diphosphatase n=2 Tax=Gammaproteobacteria TaxID=1236 RepID=UPI000E4F1A87|nr:MULTISPECIES: UDP-2,3-diacylglucosamine diphosphatase [Enterobacterales]AXU94723.1 hypothetical protein CI789_05440 [Erwinia persicina]MCX2946452.1 UDP-2,3-diacylglucosamine diphosphatase [Rahnella perminowiae]
MTIHKVKSIFVSDLHIGSQESQAHVFFKLLKTIEPANVFLLGDIFDIRSITKYGFYNIRETFEFLKFISNNKEINFYYTPGNHDPEIYELKKITSDNFEIDHFFVHTTARGEQILLLHGNVVDTHIGTRKELLIDIVSFIYKKSLIFQRKINGFIFKNNKISFVERMRYFLPPWRRSVSLYESRIKELSLSKGFESVICGHIHAPNIIKEKGFQYYNCGDFVENSTFLVENQLGFIMTYTDFILNQKPNKP